MRFPKIFSSKFLVLTLTGIICFNSLYAAESNSFKRSSQTSSYKIENPKKMESSYIDINTSWDFFWGKFVSPSDTSTKPDALVSVPSDWNKYPLSEDIQKISKTGLGSGTYRLLLTNLKPETNYVFPVYKLAYTAFEIYADNTLIYQSGTPSEDWKNSKPEQFFDTASFVPDKNGTILLTIFVSNNFYRKGGLRGTISLYEEDSYERFHFKEVSSYAIFSGILIMISVYCLIIFFLKKDKSPLYLALLILAIYSRIASSTFPIIKTIFPNMPFTVMLRIEYISVFFIPCFLTLYLDTLNKYIFEKVPAVLISAPGFIFMFLDILLPISIVNRIVPVMQIYMYTASALDAILFIFSLFKHRDFLTSVCIFSFLIIVSGATSDILLIHHASFMQGIHLLTPAFVCFAFVQIFILAYIQNQNDLKVMELNNYLHETNQAYYRFVPKEFLELLCKKDITEVTLGEYKVSKAAVLSADIRNFTSTSEKLVPIQVFDMLNSYLRRVAPLIRKYHGIIEKYLGDGIIAIFPDSAEAALNCAIEMQEQMIELREEFAERGMPQIQIGIGVHYGDIVIGTGGNNDRMTEISLSKDIDIAIKTEGKTKIYHRPILATYDAIKYAAKEARKDGRKFSFSGFKIEDNRDPAATQAVRSSLFSIYNERFENVL